jgi:hypothetical protein
MLSRKALHVKLSPEDRRKDFYFYALCAQSIYIESMMGMPVVYIE